MTQPHRVSWQTFDSGSGKRLTGRIDFNTRADAEAAKRQKQQETPDAVVTVAPILARAGGAAKAVKIGPGHPEYQGKRRMTR